MFMRSIEYYVDEVRQDRYKLAKETLKTIIDRTDGKVSLSELKEAFSQPEILEPYEVDQIMHEVRKNLRLADLINIIKTSIPPKPKSSTITSIDEIFTF